MISFAVNDWHLYFLIRSQYLEKNVIGPYVSHIFHYNIVFCT